jgi:hypothetical protein
LAEGAVLFSTDEEVYFGVNAVGARIWQLLPPATSTFEQLCAELAKQYNDVDVSRIRADARKYIDELIASGLALPAENAETRAPAISERAPKAD